MSAKPLRLDELLESIADGSPLDWGAIEASGDPGQERLLRHLRVVAGVAEVHRTAVVDEPAETVSGWPNLGGVGEARPRWGHLILVEKIGEGAFGEVYRARDPWLDREVALKLMKADVAGGDASARVVNEARTLARVRHPNVVTVHGADRHDGRVGLWMDLVRGRTLAQILAADGPCSASEAAVIGQEVCHALAAVHAAGLVHRDIKAPNVMRESGGRLVLMDFGAGGTPLYMAPEVLAGGRPTVASDLYAVGVLLYHLVTGRYPVSGTSVADLEAAHARGTRTSVAVARPDLPDAFAAVIDRALDVTPARRFGTARELREALAPATGRVAGITTGIRSWAVASVVVAALSLAAAWAWRSTPIPTSPHAIRVVAVMPLTTPAKDDEYFADGMTEALTQELAGVTGLRVISRTSVALARQSENTLPGIARALAADAILEGSAFRANDRVRVTLRLIHAGSDSPVWVRTFEEPLHNVFALQEEVARLVAADLSLALAPHVNAPQTVNAEAHDDYLRGRFELNRGTANGVKQAVTHFESAIRKDPRHARALAGAGQAYLLLGGSYNAMPRRDGFDRSRSAVERALRLDDGIAEAHAVLAEILFEHEWDFAAAEREFKRALELNPSLEYTRERYAMFLAARRETDAAVQEISQALQVDPLSLAIRSSAGGILRYARRYDEALQRYREVLARQPDFLAANVGLARTLNAMGRHEEAITRYRALAQQGINEPFFILEIAQADAAAGRTDAARRAVDSLQAKAQASGLYVPPESLAYAFARIGDFDQAFTWLDQAFRTRSGNVLWLPVDTRVDPLRRDPRFRGYLTQLGLAP